MVYEDHPLQPFLPANGRMLFLGSFPPPRIRWSMDFFYPNWINDFWRIMGMVYFQDAQHFVVPGEKRFDRESIIRFCTEQGLAFYDTARRVCRTRDNASDNFLEVVEPTDIAALLGAMPSCQDIITTGGKACETLLAQFTASSEQPVSMPPIGEYVSLCFSHRTLRWWRMPSSSRAYPLKIDRKAALYARVCLK